MHGNTASHTPAMAAPATSMRESANLPVMTDVTATFPRPHLETKTKIGKLGLTKTSGSRSGYQGGVKKREGREERDLIGSIVKRVRRHK